MVLSMLPGFPVLALAAEPLTATIDTGASVTLNDTDGDGFYEIGNADELFAFSALVNAGNNTINGKLTADIVINENVVDANGRLQGGSFREWVPIGRENRAYEGIFDGQGYTVSGLYFDEHGAYGGFFGNAGDSSQILNLGVVNSYIYIYRLGGGICGASSGLVKNCFNYNTSVKIGYIYAGGLVGHLMGRMENCYTSGKVTSNVNPHFAGAVCYYQHGEASISNCYYMSGTYSTAIQNENKFAEVFSQEDLTSGKLAYKLQQLDGIWGQNMDNGNTPTGYPMLNSTAVYHYQQGICTAPTDVYTNTQTPHQYIHDTQQGDEAYTNGYCNVCRGYQAATLVTESNYASIGVTEAHIGYYAASGAGQLMWFAENHADVSKLVLSGDCTITSDMPWKCLDNIVSVFDGNGHTITFDYDTGDTASTDNFGLFANCDEAKVKNLVLKGSIRVNTTADVGAMAGSMYGSDIENVVSHVSVTNLGSGNTGGLVGRYGAGGTCTINGCAVYGSITGTIAGGLLGAEWDDAGNYQILNCAFKGNVSGSEKAGIFIGNGAAQQVKIENTYFCVEDASLPVVGNGATVTGTTACTAEQFASGEVTYLLNGGKTADQQWFQTVGEGLPANQGETVYLVQLCNGSYMYRNTSEIHIYENYICIMCQHMSGKTVASVTIGDTTTQYGNIEQALQSIVDCTAEDKALVVMRSDVDLGESYLTINSGVFTLDLNGFEVVGANSEFGTICLAGTANMTLMDSGTTGKLIGSAYAALVLSGNAVATVVSGTLEGPTEGDDSDDFGIYGKESSSLTILGGHISGCDFGVFLQENAIATISGGTISGGKWDFHNYGSSKTTLTVGDHGVGASFPDGVSSAGKLLENLLDEKSAFWYGDHMVILGSRDYHFTDGEVVVKAACFHEIDREYINNGTDHSYYCDKCLNNVVESHSYDENEFCVCGNENPEVVARVTIGGVSKPYLSFQDAVNAVASATAQDEAVLKLQKGVYTIVSDPAIASGVFTLDLNGFFIKANSYDYALRINGSGVSMTLIDSVGGGLIKGYFAAVKLTNGTLTMDSGSVEDIEVVDGTACIQGGSLTSSGWDIKLSGENAKVILALGDDGVGPAFPRGIKVEGTTVNALLGEDMGYWIDVTMIEAAEDAVEISGGEVVVKTACKHTEPWSRANCFAPSTCPGCFVTRGEIDPSFHDETIAYDADGFCPNGCYDPAALNGDVYEISNSGQLFWLAQHIHDGSITGFRAKLMNDIVFPKDRVWTPINAPEVAGSVFDGNGHTLNIGTQSGGLFERFNYATVKNLTLYGTINAEGGNVGAAVGSAYRTRIENVISYVKVNNPNGNAGGLAGYYGGKHDAAQGLESKIINCAVYADITGNNAGGLVGEGWNGTQYYDIENCAYVGNVTGTNAGAIVGYQNTDSNTSTFTNIYWCEADGLGFYGKRDTENQKYINTEAKTTEQFTSGEVTYLLNSGKVDGIWKQTIGTDLYPTFTGKTVFYHYADCSWKECSYNNAETGTYEPGVHNFGPDGLCINPRVAGGYCSAVQNGMTAVDGVYYIETPANLLWLAQQVDDGLLTDVNAVLTGNITLPSGFVWNPIGDADHPFNGTFDGCGFTIDFGYQNVLETGYGLFGYLGNADVKNVDVKGYFNVSAPYDVAAGIAGYVVGEAYITCCRSYVEIYMANRGQSVAGIVCFVDGGAAYIDRCANYGYLTNQNGQYAAGIVAVAQKGKITNCANSGGMYTYGCQYVGGMVAYVDDPGFEGIQYCINSKEIYGGKTLGQIVGYLGDHVADSVFGNYQYQINNCKSIGNNVYPEKNAAESVVVNKYDLSSGAVAMLLQGDQQKQAWGQDMSTIYSLPDPCEPRVYAGYATCNQYYPYNNIAEGGSDPIAHQFDDQGICAGCKLPLIAERYYSKNLQMQYVDIYTALYEVENYELRNHELHIVHDVTVDDSSLYYYIYSSIYVNPGITLTFDFGSDSDENYSEVNMRGNLMGGGTVVLKNGALVLSGTAYDITVDGYVENYGKIYDGAVMNGEVYNCDCIFGGIFNGDVCNEDDIRGGTFNGNVVSDDGEIMGGNFLGNLTLNDGKITNTSVPTNFYLGENFTITYNGGTIECTSHISGSLCTESAVCRLCGEAAEGAIPGKHDASAGYDANGFCPNGCYEPAKLVDGVYEISNAGQLYWFAALSNTGYGSHPMDVTAKGKLVQDIVVNEDLMSKLDVDPETGIATVKDGQILRTWMPIAMVHDINIDYMFTGSLDGNGKTISGLYFNDPHADDVGLFGEIFEGAEIKNLTVADSYFCGMDRIGAFVGRSMAARIMNCHNAATMVVGDRDVGGLVGDGWVESELIDCTNSGKIVGNDDVGGVMGSGSNRVISNCHNSGEIIGEDAVGGILGSGTVLTSCSNSGTVTGVERVGGILGNGYTVKMCFNTGMVIGEVMVGGVAGRTNGYLQNSYNTGTITGTEEVGGLVGYCLNGNVRNCFNTGEVTGSELVAEVIGNNNGGEVGNCYYLVTDGDSELPDNNVNTVTGLPSENFASGEVTWLLNEANAEGVWKQTIGTDLLPNFTGSTVYYGYISCADQEKAYTNTAASADPIEHSWLDATCTEPKTCSACGATEGEALGHTPGQDDGDCTTAVSCAVCGEEAVPAKDAHSYEYGECTNDGCEVWESFEMTYYVDGVAVHTETYTAGSAYYLWTAEDKDDLTFLGWATEEGGELVYAVGEYIWPGADMQFYAVYGKLYTINYHNYDSEIDDYWADGSAQVIAGNSIVLGTQYSYWFKCIGWATQPGGEMVYAVGQEITPVGDLELYAVAVPFQATVDLGAEDATYVDENGDPITVISGTMPYSTVYLTNFPTRPGYVFLGFDYYDIQTNEETGERYIEISMTEDITVTAQWELCSHSWNDATCTAPKTCSNCGATEGDSLGGHTDADNSGCCDICDCVMESAKPVMTGKAFSLSFEDEIRVNFYYTVSDATYITEHGMLVFYSDPGTADFSKADAVYNKSVSDPTEAYYGVSTAGIAAREMGDTRYYVAYAKLDDGTYVYSNIYGYSPKQYAMNMLGRSTTSDKQKVLCVALLNFGAAAQEYFGYKTDALMNAELTDEQKALVVPYDKTLFTGAVEADESKLGAFAATATGFSEMGATVSLEGAFSVNYYITPDATVDRDMTLYIWTSEAYAAAGTLTADNASQTMTMVARSDGSYWGQVSNIAAKCLDDTYYVAGVYTDDSGNTYCTGVIAYSVSQYCLNKAVDGSEMQQLAGATAMYGYYAKQYFTK